MAYKNLNSPEMAALSRHWLGPARPILEGLAMGPALIHDHEAFLALQAAAAEPDDDQLAAADAAVHAADFLHDRLLRGGYYVLTGLAELAPDEAGAARCLGARDRLYPGGLDMTRRTFLDQASAAEAVETRVTDDDRALFASVSLPGGTLAEVVAAWRAAGETLREADHRRAVLRKTAGGVAPSDLVAARNRWIRSVHMLVASLEYAELDDAARNRLLAALNEAEARADQRARRAATAPTPA